MEKKFNIQEYIDSGILEQFVLGLTSSQENLEIQSYIQKYPELKKEIIEIERTLEKYASQYSKPMSDDLKNKIVRSIDDLKVKNDTLNNSGSWITKALMFSSLLVLFLCSYYFWKTGSEMKIVQNLQFNKLEYFKKLLEQDSLALMDCKNQLNYFRNKNSIRVILKGTTNSPHSIAVVYYDTISSKTMLDVLTLPEVPKEKQYQLWAIVKGKPVDLGVFDLDKNNSLKDIKFVSNANAFAITLEQKGGVVSPTMSQMFVIGEP